MTWTAVVRGQPTSLNDLYEVSYRYGKSGKYAGITKTAAADQYHRDCVLQLRVAAPKDFKPAGQVRIVLDAVLGHDIDCDNLLKILMDSLQEVTGINDRQFLTCWRSKVIGSKDPRIFLEVSEEPEGCHCGRPT